MRRIGGATGDVHGAAQQAAEAGALVGLAMVLGATTAP
jgi:cobalamin synthase